MPHNGHFFIMVERSCSEGWPIVSVSGEVDISTVEVMRQEIADVLLTSPRLVVDLREVTFMDSSGLATLIMANRSVVKGAMRLVVTRTRMLRLFDLAGVMSVLPVFDSVQAATEAPGPLDAEAAD